MATFNKIPLNGGGNDGLGILVAATTTAGTVIHTASATAATVDEIWLYAYNNHSADILLTVEFGGVTAPKDVIKFTVPFAKGLFLVSSGLIVQGNATPKIVRAFAATANQISLFGYVNRIA